MRSTVTERGQTVVPARIRRDHRIEPRPSLSGLTTAIRSGSSRFLRIPSERRAAVPTGWAGVFSRSASASVPAAERYLLDTSAILAFTAREDGFDNVQELLERATGGEIDVGAAGSACVRALGNEFSLLNLPYK